MAEFYSIPPTNPLFLPHVVHSGPDFWRNALNEGRFLPALKLKRGKSRSVSFSAKPIIACPWGTGSNRPVHLSDKKANFAALEPAEEAASVCR